MSESDNVNKFVQLLVGSQQRLYAFIRAQVSSRDDADEILQQTSMILWEKFDRFRPDGDFTRWACGIARREILAHFRNQKRFKLLLHENIANAVADKLVDLVDTFDDRQDALAECMKGLSKRQRELIHRRYVDDESVKEIAEQIGLTQSSVYKSLSNIRDVLYNCIQQKLFSQP